MSSPLRPLVAAARPATHRPIALAFASLLAATLAGCAADEPSDLVGSLDVTLGVANGFVHLTLDSSTTKFRAQVIDDGSTCRLEIAIDEEGSSDTTLHAWSRLTAAESAPLLAGATATVTASDRAPAVGGVKPQVIVNNATFVLQRGGTTTYSTGGTLEFEALPAPKGALRVHLRDVLMRTPGTDVDQLLQGEASLTYIGRNAIRGTTSACPALAPVPGGLVY